MRIVPKLNLNKTPETVDNNSLIFAKNVRLHSNALCSDYGVERIDEWKRKVGNNTIRHALEDNEYIVGVIPYNTCFYLFIHSDEYTDDNDTTIQAYSKILKYDEINHTWTVCNCNWNWSGGKIDGVVNLNLNGDIILTIGEYFEDSTDNLVPIKSINLSDSSIDDDESIYTQAPNIPIVNLVCREYYDNVIPAGVYQFFIRFEIRKNFYTGWIPVSKELFAATQKSQLTNQGGLRYIDNNIDSNFSFRLNVEWVNETYKSNYNRFQLGFILSHDGESYARAYKHYDIGTSIINFDYNTEFITEIDTRELLEPIVNYYNVGNITNFKNKLYISNYTEFEFNPDIEKSENSELKDFVNGCSVGYATKLLNQDNTYFNIPCTVVGNYITKIGESDDEATVKEIVEDLMTSHLSAATSSINANSYGNTFTYLDSVHRVTLHVNRVATRYDQIRPNYSGPYNQFEDVGGTGLIGLTTLSALIAAIKNKIDKIDKNNGNFVDSSGNPSKGLNFTFDTYVDLSNLVPQTYGYDSDATLAKIQTKIWFTIDLIALSDTKINTFNVNTLIPYQSYKFYVHLVKETGEQTNGYEIGTLTIPNISRGTLATPYIIYPTFTFSKKLPTGYVSCFMSIVHTNTITAQIFDVHTISASNYIRIAGDCLELDTNILPNLFNIPAKIYDEDAIVDYKASYDADSVLTFGSSGKIIVRPTFTGTYDSTDVNDRYGYLLIPFELNKDYVKLTRCTGYLKIPNLSGVGSTYTTNDSLLDDMNLLGYLCTVCKPNDNIKNYISGSDIYKKTYTFEQQATTPTWHVEPVEEDIDTESKIEYWSESFYSENGPDVEYGTYQESHVVTIYSNYNLNCLSLRDEITPRLVTKYIDNEDNVVKSESTVADTNNSDISGGTKTTFILLAHDSSTLSEIYELQSTYFSYIKPENLVYTRYNVLTKFDNTIRSSILEGDEAKINTYRFKTTDYYNVPTDKGIVINLVAVGNNILVHTQDSIFAFNGSNSLMAKGGEEVQMTESEPFDTGIQELFGSEYGYAGLKNKAHQTLSEFGYTFWDADSMRIYIYTGESQIKVLSEDISKLFKRDNKKVESVLFADDYYNNRIFICITFEDNKVVTLSYDFSVRSFISTHDFKFDWSFKTKTRCYFIYDITQVYRIDNKLGSYSPLFITDANNLYPKHSDENCIVDVILNDRFESIKTLNSLAWICNKIVGFNANYNMAEESYEIGSNPEERYKGNYLRIYTDSCMTDIIDISGRSNDARLRHNESPYSIVSNANSYRQVRYNLGKWTYNYFRNILYRSNDQLGTRPFRQDDTLIYGKYIVARFIFNRDVDFKFEDVAFNVSIDNNI